MARSVDERGEPRGVRVARVHDDEAVLPCGLRARLRLNGVQIGSGFGGSVSALRLTEKGYKVLVLEKGRRFRPEDFPKTNWDVPHWMWMPAMGLRGIFQMSFFEHVTILHGVGVGGAGFGLFQFDLSPCDVVDLLFARAVRNHFQTDDRSFFAPNLVDDLVETLVPDVANRAVFPLASSMKRPRFSTL